MGQDYCLTMNFVVGRHLESLTGPILITGHTGFKGTWLTLLLERLGVSVVGYSLAPEQDSLFERAERTGAIPESFADIRDFESVSEFMRKHEPSAVIHMAAQPLVLESYRIPRETFEINVLGTANILETAFATESIKAIGAITTDKVYRNDNSGRAFIESDPLSGKDPYSASKVGAESVVAAWQQISRNSNGPKVIALRAGNVIGGGDWATNRLLPDLIRGFSSETKMTVRNPTSTRPWQHVLDPLSGYISAMDSIIGGAEISSLNFGPSSESLEVSRIVDIARDVWPSPTFVEMSSDSVTDSKEATSLQLDSTAARKVLGWKPHWTQEESVVATVKWWDKVLNKGVPVRTAVQFDIDNLLNGVRSLGNR